MQKHGGDGFESGVASGERQWEGGERVVKDERNGSESMNEEKRPVQFQLQRKRKAVKGQ